MPVTTPVSPRVFKAIEKSDIHTLACCREEEIRPILPCLVRMSLIAPLDHSEECIAGRKVILRILSGIEVVNSLVALLSIDFPALEVDVKKEQQLRQKLGGGNQSESVLVQNLANGLALEFECSDPTRRLRLLLSEILLVMAQIREPRQDFYHKTSELFDNPCYLEEVSDVLCIALAELPALLPPAEVAEALLHVTNGPILIARMVANQPDCFREVVTGLVMTGDKQDEDSQGGLLRLQAVRTLCQMNPNQALNVRALCVEQCRMPGLAVYLTLDAGKTGFSIASSSGGVGSSVCGGEGGDVVSYVTGLLLSHNHQQRTWFAQFVKSGQRRKYEQQASALVALRTDLSERLRNLLLFNSNDTLPDSQVIHATALLRLYCALKSLANLKFSEDKEIGLLLQLVTCHPPPSAAGVRFVSTGLCMLIACPSLISSQENERRASEWIKWLVKEEAYFAGASGVSSSFGAMLLLMAIHFHVQQLSAIIELVSAALGMKVITRANNLSRIKYIFTHDVFTEQVVTAHAVKVPVTSGLNANIPGFLPVHCVYHQLKSRMFTKHKVPIKDWIYNQICASSTPLHPVMPQLTEVYVNSIILPGSKGAHTDTFNEPISEEEIMAVFSQSIFTEKAPVQDPKPVPKTSAAPFRSLCTKRSMLRERPLFSLSSGQIMPSPSSVSAQLAPHTSMIGNSVPVASVMTSQLLLLYYLLLYEDVRLNNTHQLLANSRRVHSYSPHLFAQLPIRYLLSHAQKEQRLYAGLFSPLVKLLVSHYPQLCLVEDWLYQSPSANSSLGILPPRVPLDPQSVSRAMEDAADKPGRLLVLLDRLMRMPPHQLWPLAAPITASIKCLLQPGVPRKVLDTYRQVWMRLNSLFPRRLWAMTVEGLLPEETQGRSRKMLTEDDIILDPLYVLRCADKVYRCAPLLQLVMYMLQVYLLSSRTFLSQQMQNTPVVSSPHSLVGGNNNNAPQALEEEREKLRGALVLTQESSAVQILLEACLMKDYEKVGRISDGAGALALQEIRSIVCSYIHQAFLKDTTLAKLVHFQGYPGELLGPVVRGVPSMHIAIGLNWIPELLQLPDLDKQLFAVELTSHLALQNAMPSTLSISRLGINTMATLLSVLGEEERIMIMEASLPSLVGIGRAFPALTDDLVHLLVMYGRVSTAQSALSAAPAPKSIAFLDTLDEETKDSAEHKMDYEETLPPGSLSPQTLRKHLVRKVPREDSLYARIIAAFRKIVAESSMTHNLY
ncbi:integrator complex subunit 2-like isoform X1 [Homarus americanus]|uniref:integrator complex subunit 2-like isoform X1 n=2 Tax=Homarus americanus TaxID=6706 RepID=UPI001C4683F0|nr:integrator complex subunit 2-like isoform X1 [Homarus americanus]